MASNTDRIRLSFRTIQTCASTQEATMYHVRQEALPFVGSSHQFIGAEQGDVNISVFLLSAQPGNGPGPHRHPYDEVQFVR
ncbi:MAG TPA: hypothetical protein VM009_02880, partial [Terriglobales bacterium]|nr:hypothetical protein [Terriglobales bacterium]